MIDKSAVIAGCDPEASETLAMLLELLEWRVTVVGAIDPQKSVPARLVFIAATQLQTEMLTWLAAAAATDGCYQVIVGPRGVHNVGYARVMQLALPLDVAACERIIELAS